MPETDEKIERGSCWIDKGLLRLAKEISARQGITASEAIERDLAGPLQRRHRKVFPNDYADLGGEAGGA